MRKLLLLVAFCIGLSAADATIEVVNRGVVLPRILVQDATTNFSNAGLKNKFFKIMIGDLKVGSSFEVIEDYYTSTYDGDYKTNLANSKNPELILRYAITNQGSGLALKVKLINAKNGTTRYEGAFTQSELAKYPFLAHTSVADIARNLNLSPIDWMDKSIIISQYTSPGKSNIIVADYTLTYQKVILSGGLNIFPKWANKDQSAFYYTSYIKSVPTLFRYDLRTGQKTKITTSSGMIVASDVSKDGSKLLLTMAPDDQSDIFLYDLRTNRKTRITNFKGIDVNGNFVENDTKIVFVSDRMGYPNVFTTSVNGGVVEQMVFHGKNNNSVTTYQNYVVYSSRESSNEYGTKTFNLYLISTKSDYIRQLTGSGVNTYPRFSSDGGSIVFIKNSGNESAVGIIRVNENKSFQFPLRIGKLQSIDW
ncbi:Tol-Pal system translocation protein TolB [Campylobacter iguaniorum]|uniref:Tol-Pal system translocation protein TolB n=1 Tax=Campylobacter iguaniorum TaxID=1244531 RepID=A0A076FCA8_9BACT|nr:Tol-Pal system protein TolB [Campylobacter iguaniorum]AII15293.1 Tol-Pal system translocation protein TolB [Campylobacter iguaniorum]ALV25219.1 Tol-Pal system translocation protein TolB [Campylobacter iguaniorum]